MQIVQINLINYTRRPQISNIAWCVIIYHDVALGKLRTQGKRPAVITINVVQH
jgi:hypothetical protein